MAVPPQYSGCTVEAATPAVEATALSTAACTPPAPNCSAPQVRPGSSSVDVTVYTCALARGCCVRPTPRPTATAARRMQKETLATMTRRRLCRWPASGPGECTSGAGGEEEEEGMAGARVSWAGKLSAPPWW